MDELRIVLLGKQLGAGKSASGNTLLCDQSFHTAASSGRVTETCSMSMFTVNEQTIKVIDTPGWCNSSRFETDIKREVMKCISISSPGPHVFLLVLPIGRFTNEEINTVMNILTEFGDEVTKYMIVLFTKGDDLEDRPIEDYLKEVHPDLKAILHLCGKRYHVFNNRDKKNHHQVSSLLKKINEMVEWNKGTCYTTAMFKKVKNQQIDKRRGQQFRREADNSVQNKNLSESEDEAKRNRYDAEGDSEEKKSISEDTKEQCCERKLAQQQNSTQNREHEGLKDGKRDLEDKNEDKCYTSMEDTSKDRKELNDKLVKERDEQPKRWEETRRELETVKNHLEQLKQEVKRQKKVIEILEQENQEVKQKTMALQNDVVHLEETLTKQKTTEEKKSTFMYASVISLCGSLERTVTPV